MMWPSQLLSLTGLLCLQCTNAFSTLGSIPSSHSRRFSALSASYGSESESHDDGSSHLHQRRDFVIQSIAAAGVVSSVIHPFIAPAFADDNESSGATTTQDIIDPSIDLPKITNKVYLDIKFGKYKPKKLVIGLFGDAMPKTVENFLTLCTNNDGPSYNGSTFYRGKMRPANISNHELEQILFHIAN